MRDVPSLHNKLISIRLWRSGNFLSALWVWKYGQTAELGEEQKNTRSDAERGLRWQFRMSPLLRSLPTGRVTTGD